MTTEPVSRPDPGLRRERPVGHVPAGAQDDARRHRLELPGVGRGHGLHRSRQGRPRLGPGRQRVRRPADGLRPGDPRSRRRRVDDYVNERMRSGVSFSLTSEDEVQAMELDLRADRLGRHGAHDRVGHRGDDARDARRPRLHRPRQDRQVRGPVPRRPRLRPDQRAARTTCRELGDADNRSRLAWGRGIPKAVAETIIPARYNNLDDAAPAVRARQASDIAAVHRRARAGQRAGHPAAAGLPRGDARADPGVRRAAHLRRGQDRVPASPAAAPRSSSASRRTSRRTPRRWATATRRPRSAARREVMGVLPEQGQPRRHVRRQPGRGRRGGQDARDPPRHGRARDRSTPPAARVQAGLARSSNQPACPTSSPAIRHVRDHVHRDDARPSTATGRTPTTSCTTRSPSGMHARGAMPEPDSAGALVHLRGARRRRPRRSRRHRVRGVARRGARGSCTRAGHRCDARGRDGRRRRRSRGRLIEPAALSGRRGGCRLRVDAGDGAR